MDTSATSKHQSVWRYHTLVKEDVSHLVPMPDSCIVFQLWSEQEGSLCGSPVVLEMGLHTVFTTVGTPTVHLPVRWGEKQTRVFSERYSRERDVIIIFTFCNSQLCLTATRSPTCWLEHPQAKDPVECRAKKKPQFIRSQASCFRSLFLKLFHVIQVLFSSGSCRAVSVIPDKIPLSFTGVPTRCCNFFTHITHAISYFESCITVDVWM